MRVSFRFSVAILAGIALSGCRDPQQDAAVSLTAAGIVTQLNVAGKVSRVDATDASLPGDFWMTLAEFPELTALVLTSADLSDRDMASLDSFENLKSLDISYTEVGSVGIGHLARLLSLRDLALNGVTLDEKCVQSLAGMRQLRSLALVQTNLNDEQFQQLQSALPGCLLTR
jgi:hypothetical protein